MGCRDGGGTAHFPRRATAAAQHGFRLPRPQLRNHSGAPHRPFGLGRPTHRTRRRRPALPEGGAATPAPGPRQADGAGHRRLGAALGFRQQRPSGRHARLRPVRLPQSLRRGAGQAAAVVHRQRQRLPHRAGLAAAGPSGGGGGGRPAKPRRRLGSQGAGGRHQDHRRPRRHRGCWRPAGARRPGRAAANQPAGFVRCGRLLRSAARAKQSRQFAARRR